MVPRIGKQGSSFKGAALYYLHDKDALTAERVAFTYTENLPTNNPELAWRIMAYTAMSSESLKREAGVKATGNRSEKPVWTMSLSWHPSQSPDQAHMIQTMKTVLGRLGLSEHQVLMTAHRDEPHPHIHAIANLVHPVTGKTATLPYSKEKLSKWAEEYEREHGEIYCEQRVENNARREQQRHERTAKAKDAGKETAAEYPRHKESELDLKAELTRRYRSADSGKAFQAAVEEMGYTLAQSGRVLLIDPQGNVHSLTRQLEGVKAKDLRAKLSDIVLPDIDQARSRIEGHKGKEGQARPEPAPEIIDRDRQDRNWQEAVIDAGLRHDEKANIKTPPPPVPARLLNALQSRHHDERAQFGKDSQQARDKLAEKLEQQYGDYERSLRRDIAGIEQRSSNPGAVRQWLRKLTGREKQDAEDLADKRKSLVDVQTRKTEATQSLEKSLARQEKGMNARQRREGYELERKWRASNSDGGRAERRTEALLKEISKERSFRPQPDRPLDLER